MNRHRVGHQVAVHAVRQRGQAEHGLARRPGGLAGGPRDVRRVAEVLSFGQVPEPDASGAPPTDREFWAGPDDDSLGSAAEAARAATARTASSPPAPQQLSLDFDATPTLEGALRAPWKWEELLVDAAVIGGYDRWSRRIGGLENELRLKLEQLQGDEPDSPKRRAIGRDLANLGHLSRFALPLIETLAETIAMQLGQHFAPDGVRVCVRKPHAPIKGVLDHVAVEIERTKEAWQ